MLPSFILEPGFLEGWVRHQRFSPRPHTFTVNKTWVCIDVDQLTQFGENCPGWEYDKFGLHTLSRESFMGSPNISIRMSIEHLLEEHDIHEPLGQILAISACQDIGMGINPAQFYLVHDLEANLIAIICELRNARNEQFPYVFIVEDPTNLTFKTEKALFMSPYTQMDATYFWQFYIGKRHFMVRLEIEKPEDPNGEKVNTLLFPEKAKKDAFKKKIMELTLSTTLRPFTESVAKELSYKYALGAVKIWFQRFWNRLMLNENGWKKHKHPSELNEEHPKSIPPATTIRRSKRFR